jgi:uncharacterized protein YndB with AHSA1/START domain
MQIPDQIERETVIEAPIERVWALITEPEHVGTWFADAGAEIDLRPGGAMTLRWEEHGTYQARVERVEPPRLFAYRGALDPDAGDSDFDEGNSTLIEFTLAEEGDATRLRVVESGFSRLTGSEEQRRKRHDGNVEGWEGKIGEFAEYAQRVAA